METAADKLPEAVDIDGFFGHVYAEYRDGILADVEALKKLTKPHSIAAANSAKRHNSSVCAHFLDNAQEHRLSNRY
ncbi:MAG: hypothetical protein AAGA63_14625 [Pseudomonadota bacterium]